MQNYIAVKNKDKNARGSHLWCDKSHLMQQLLLFDKIVMPDLDQEWFSSIQETIDSQMRWRKTYTEVLPEMAQWYLKMFPTEKDQKKWLQDFELLIKEGIIYSSSILEATHRYGAQLENAPLQLKNMTLEEIKAFGELLDTLDEDKAMWDKLQAMRLSNTFLPGSNEYKEFELIEEKYIECEYRSHTALLRCLEKENNFIPLSSNIQALPEKVTTKKIEVLNLVLHQMPAPGPNTQIEKIIEFKNNPDSKGTAWGLRSWISDVAKNNLTIQEIEEKLEYSLYKYSTLLKYHKIETTKSTVETIVTTVADVLDNCIHLKFSDAAKTFFSLTKQNIPILKQELQLEGSELAYIYRVRKEFQ